MNHYEQLVRDTFREIVWNLTEQIDFSPESAEKSYEEMMNVWLELTSDSAVTMFKNNLLKNEKKSEQRQIIQCFSTQTALEIILSDIIIYDYPNLQSFFLEKVTARDIRDEKHQLGKSIKTVKQTKKPLKKL